MEQARRTVLKGAIAAGALAAMPKGSLARASSPPNFLFIMADDLGWADLSCYGQTYYRTPEIDKLAASGMRFTQAYANSAVCSATRVALMTGRYQYRLPVGLEEPLALRPLGLPPEHPTLPSLLRSAGYSTSLIGKWHLGALPDFGPLKSGYDDFWGIRGGGVDYFSHNISNEHDLWDGDTSIERTGYLTDLIGDRAIETLEHNAKAGKPFLLSLHFTAPHWPWEGPADEAVSRELAASKSPFAEFHADGGSLDTYAEMVKQLDLQVGRILATLKRLKLDRDTVVVFTSDNGGERFSNTWPLSGKKSELLEGGIRVPCIVRWPGLTTAGTSSEAQVMSMDWLPTFVAAAGIAPAASHAPDGLDIRAALSGGKLPERPLFWRYLFQKQEAVRLGDWKYLQIGGNSFLFNLRTDEMERANLKFREPDKFRELTALWSAWNSTMLPLDPKASTHGLTGDVWTDRNGGVAAPFPR